MDENITKTIEELELIVKALHRSAADLDNAIEKIKLVGLTEGGDYLKSYIRVEMDHRNAKKKYAGYGELDEMDDDIWQRLCADVSK